MSITMEFNDEPYLLPVRLREDTIKHVPEG